MAGKGICLRTTEGGNLLRKSIRLFETMETPEVENITVDWNVPRSGERFMYTYVVFFFSSVSFSPQLNKL